MAPRKFVALAALSALSTLLLMYSSHGGGGGLLGGGGGGEAASTGLAPAPAPPLAPVPTAAPPYTAAPGPVPVPQPGPVGSGSGAAPPPPPPPTAAAPGSAGVALAEPPPPLPPATEATPASAGAGAALAEPVEGCNPRIAPAPDQMRPLRWLFYQTQVHHKKRPSLRHCIMKMRSFYQHTLGTNVGQVEVKQVVYRRTTSTPAVTRSLSSFTAAPRAGKETPFWRHFILKTPSFYQDRLGTNIGKAQKRAAFSYSPLVKESVHWGPGFPQVTKRNRPRFSSFR